MRETQEAITMLVISLADELVDMRLISLMSDGQKESKVFQNLLEINKTRF